MKINSLPLNRIATIAIAAAFGLCASCASVNKPAGKPAVDPALLAKAKISQSQAEKIALTKAPDGAVSKSKLREKKGKLLWSIELTRPKTVDITEVKIDAKTGKILEVEKENPNKEKNEKNEKKEKED